MISRNKKTRLSHKQSGFTLIEVMVTVIIMSVGLLGVAALHLTSLKNSYDSTIQSKAIWLSEDIIERMRANRSAARASNYDVVYGGSVSGATVAATDVTAWKALLSNVSAGTNAGIGLPGGDGEITTTPVGLNRVLLIKIHWLERGNTREFRTQTEL